MMSESPSFYLRGDQGANPFLGFLLLPHAQLDGRLLKPLRQDNATMHLFHQAFGGQGLHVAANSFAGYIQATRQVLDRAGTIVAYQL